MRASRRRGASRQFPFSLRPVDLAEADVSFCQCAPPSLAALHPFVCLILSSAIEEKGKKKKRWPDRRQMLRDGRHWTRQTALEVDCAIKLPTIPPQYRVQSHFHFDPLTAPPPFLFIRLAFPCCQYGYTLRRLSHRRWPIFPWTCKGNGPHHYILVAGSRVKRTSSADIEPAVRRILQKGLVSLSEKTSQINFKIIIFIQ